MKFSLRWLKDYIDFDISEKELAHKLTMAGLEVESVKVIEDDVVFELEITPNRPDCLNIFGIAREVSAILNEEKNFPIIAKADVSENMSDIEILDKEGCLRYIGIIIKDVEVKKTQKFILERIKPLGLRSINNIVDITNFCLLEVGQPLHAFDYDKLHGGKIEIRRARKGEKIITIDDVQRELDPSILVIADDARPVAIAGIMGGKDTEVTDSTKNILLESAYFDPILIRRASRKLGLSSDASYRFERSVDYETVETGANRALSLILGSANGKIDRTLDIQVEREKFDRDNIVISIEKINAYLGSTLTSSKCLNILRKLEFEVEEKDDKFFVKSPSFRCDIREEVDIIEEIARIVGFDNLPISLPNIKAFNMPINIERKIRDVFSGSFIAQGFREVISYSMINQKALKNSRQEDLAGLEILNPLTSDHQILRPTMLPSLLKIVQFNINRGEKNLKIFESGKIYFSKGEKERIAVMMTGQRENDWRRVNEKEVSFFDIKGALEEAFQKVRLENVSFQRNRTYNFFEEGTSAVVFVGKEEIGFVGKIREDVLGNWNIEPRSLYFAEIALDGIKEKLSMDVRYQAISEYPSIVWDISLAVKKTIRFQQVVDIATGLGSGILTDIIFKEEYIGEKIQEGYRGIIFSLAYQSKEKTLTEEEVSLVHDKICKALIENLEAIKR